MSDSEDRRPDEGTQKEEDEPRIKVTDRRLFDREGNLREETAESRDAGSSDTGSGTSTSGRIVEPSAADIDQAKKSSPEADAELETPPSAARGEPTRGPAAGGPEPSAGEGRTGAKGPGTRRPAGAAERPSPEDLPRDFSSFIEGQFFEGMLYLGAIRHPQTGEVIEDLELAKYKIDVLDMLQDKTEGNLEPDEKRKLEDVLYQLRMVYVQKSKDGEAPTPGQSPEKP